MDPTNWHDGRLIAGEKNDGGRTRGLEEREARSGGISIKDSICEVGKDLCNNKKKTNTKTCRSIFRELHTGRPENSCAHNKILLLTQSRRLGTKQEEEIAERWPGCKKCSRPTLKFQVTITHLDKSRDKISPVGNGETYPFHWADNPEKRKEKKKHCINT